jgi:type I restriction-modification system DNA methylase subunit
MAKRNSKNTPAPKFETILWQAADKLRGNLDAADYKRHSHLGVCHSYLCK